MKIRESHDFFVVDCILVVFYRFVERGERDISFENIIALARVLKVPLKE